MVHRSPFGARPADRARRRPYRARSRQSSSSSSVPVTRRVRAASACSPTPPVRSSTASTPSTPTRRSPSPSPSPSCISSSSRLIQHDPGWADPSRSHSVASRPWSLSHHVTGWFTVGFLVVWAAGLYLTANPRRHLTLTGWGPALALFAAPTADGSAAPPSAWKIRHPTGPTPRPRPAGSYPTGGGPRPASSGSPPRSDSSSAALGRLFVGRLLTPYLGPVFDGRVGRPRRRIGQRSRGSDALQERRGWRITPLGDRPDPGICLRLVPHPGSLAVQRDLQAECARWCSPLYPCGHRSHLSDLGRCQHLRRQQAGGRARHDVHLLRRGADRWRLAGPDASHETVA